MVLNPLMKALAFEVLPYLETETEVMLITVGPAKQQNDNLQDYDFNKVIFVPKSN